MYCTLLRSVSFMVWPWNSATAWMFVELLLRLTSTPFTPYL